MDKIMGNRCSRRSEEGKGKKEDTWKERKVGNGARPLDKVR